MSPIPFSPITIAPTGSSAMPGFYSGSAVAPPGGAGHSIFDYQGQNATFRAGRGLFLLVRFIAPGWALWPCSGFG